MLNKYNLEYYENMLRNYSKTGETISKIRWEFINRLNPHNVLDYGCGVSWFRAYRPDGINVDTFDIGPYPQTGVSLKIYDVTCFWDVLEHIPDFSVIEPILRISNNIAVSLPISPGEIDLNWKHYKPGEHLHYFTHETLDVLFKRYGFNKLIDGTPECPPREDIWSFIYKKLM